MQIFKNKAFSRWARDEGLSDHALIRAVAEIEQGLLEADLGGHLIKKRVAIGSRGKSRGLRTLLAFKKADRAFFIYGFAKQAQANIKVKELKALKRYATELLGYSKLELSKAKSLGEVIEVKP